jgi:hypothetical protein
MMASAPGTSGERNGPVIVAMATVHVVKVALDEIIGVIAVRHRFVSAAGAVSVRRVVSGAFVIRCASRRVQLAHRDRVLLDPGPALKMQVAVVQVVLMSIVCDASVAAVGAMNVLVARLGMLALRL